MGNRTDMQLNKMRELNSGGSTAESLAINAIKNLLYLYGFENHCKHIDLGATKL